MDIKYILFVIKCKCLIDKILLPSWGHLATLPQPWPSPCSSLVPHIPLFTKGSFENLKKLFQTYPCPKLNARVTSNNNGNKKSHLKTPHSQTCLVVQWIWICLIQKDPTCLGATQPMHHNSWAHALQLLKPVCLEPMLRIEKPLQWEACALQLKKDCLQLQGPSATQR